MCVLCNLSLLKADIHTLDTLKKYADDKAGKSEIFTYRQAGLESKEGGIIYGQGSPVKFV